jgi:hypothetical protein
MRPHVLLIAVATTACAHHQPAEAVAVNAAPAPSATTSTAPAPPASQVAPSLTAPRSCASDAECGSTQICVESRCSDVTDGLAACDALRVHFGYDDATLDRSELPILQRAARCAIAVPVIGSVERPTPYRQLRQGATAVYRPRRGLLVPEPAQRNPSRGRRRAVADELGLVSRPVTRSPMPFQIQQAGATRQGLPRHRQTGR